MAEFDVTSNHSAPGDQFMDSLETNEATKNELAVVSEHPMDSAEAREVHRRLLKWYFYEKDKQSENRLEMAIDHDCYDNKQWDDDDAQAVRERGQIPLVYNEVAPMCDWLIGTELRTQVDWKVLPRTEDDVEMADVKTKVMKFVSDVNRIQFVRSKAFADTIKGGLGWVDDGARDDPSKDAIYSSYQDWRNVLHDSDGYDLDTSDMRFIFRWRWVDEDIALMLAPDRKHQIQRAIENYANGGREFEEESWYDGVNSASGTIHSMGSGGMVDAERRKIKLIECQYRMPEMVTVVDSGPLQGQVFDPRDKAMGAAIAASGSMLVDKFMMRMHVALFTETDMLHYGPSIYRHNGFSLTPIWCYRRGRDRMPYGVIRRVRDIQMDINKRASKALFLLNTNQIIMETGAVDDLDVLRDEAARPDGVIEHKQGKALAIRRDAEQAAGQIDMMAMGAKSIQRSGGVADENLGRQTNAVSGEAIKARQVQGSVVTTEPFNNLRLAVQVQGEKQLSLTEQFYTQEKVVRLVGSKGALEWVKLNQPEVQADGSIRYINDITASKADFIVMEQDYAGTLRQVMFDSMNQIAGRLPPEVALKLLTIAYENSDFPNKDEIADAFRSLTGERDPNKELTPEEQQADQKAKAEQAEAMEIQRQGALMALQEQTAKVRELNAKAAKMEAEVKASGGDASGEAMQIHAKAAQEIDRLSNELRQAQAAAQNETYKINKEADTNMELARIDAAARERVAEIQAGSDKRIEALTARIDALQPVASMADSKPSTNSTAQQKA
jgi:hypothetical protein